jgi:zeaxanthin epoxidase
MLRCSLLAPASTAQVLKEVTEKGNTIGDKRNGLKDGLSGEWFANFDLQTPAAARNQAYSLVIDRPVLQEILMKHVGNTVTNGAEVVGAESSEDCVKAVLSDGTRYEADLLVGSDGIRSMTRSILNPDDEMPTWSG